MTLLRFISEYLEDVAVAYAEDTKDALRGVCDPPPGVRLAQRRKARQQDDEDDEEMYGV